jgi:hypothetical protein
MPETLKPRLPVAIIGFKRSKPLESIVQAALKADSLAIYIYLDGPRNFQDFDDVKATQDVALEYQLTHPDLVKVFIRSENIGAATSVLTSANHFFSEFSAGIILEDDCIPSKDFFDYAIWAVSIMRAEPTIALAGGFLPLPNRLLVGKPILSKYIQIWGWVCTSDKWRIIRDLLEESSNVRRFSLDPNTAFWAAGNRRANRGYADAWDTPLSFVIQQNGLKCLLPNANLISNIGDDLAATHTKESSWLHSETGTFIPCEIDELEAPPSIEEWFMTNYFGIRFKHIFTTQITYILDFFRRPARPNLQSRISANRI